MQALKGVGRCARLEGAAAQKARARLLDALGHIGDLFQGLHRTGAGDDLEIPAADFAPRAAIDHGVLGVELAVGVFVRLLNALDVFDDLQRFEHVDVHRGGIADQPQQRLVAADGHVYVETH